MMMMMADHAASIIPSSPSLRLSYSPNSEPRQSVRSPIGDERTRCCLLGCSCCLHLPLNFRQ